MPILFFSVGGGFGFPDKDLSVLSGSRSPGAGAEVTGPSGGKSRDLPGRHRQIDPPVTSHDQRRQRVQRDSYTVCVS
jgi:hypothetical protein